MEVLMEVSRVGAEVEVETTTVDSAATETVRMMEVDETETIIEVVVALAHVLGAQIEIHGAHEETAVIVMTRMPSQEKIAENEMRAVEQVEVQNERLHLR